jgi:hypothetical protein
LLRWPRRDRFTSHLGSAPVAGVLRCLCFFVATAPLAAFLYSLLSWGKSWAHPMECLCKPWLCCCMRQPHPSFCWLLDSISTVLGLAPGATATTAVLAVICAQCSESAAALERLAQVSRGCWGFVKIVDTRRREVPDGYIVMYGHASWLAGVFRHAACWLASPDLFDAGMNSAVMSPPRLQLHLPRVV